MNRSLGLFLLLAILPSAFAAQCALTAFPDYLDAGKTSLVTITYSGYTESSNGVIINCGNGHSVAAFGCAQPTGYCNANCYFPAAGSYDVNAKIGSTACTPATVTVNKPSADCGDGICDADIGESPVTCPADCGALNYCGDGICDYGESTSTCPEDCGVAPTTCSDGTRYSTCSATAPYYCDNGLLVNKSSICGCADGYKAKDEYCVQKTCTDGSAKSTCAIQKPLYCNANAVLEERSSLCGCPLGTTASGNNCLAPGSCSLFSAYAIDYFRNVTLGEDAKYSLLVANPSSSAQQVSLSATMIAGISGEFTKSYITLPAGNTTYSELTLHTGSATPGDYQLNITAQAANCQKSFPINLTVSSNGTYSACCSTAQSLSASIDNTKDRLVRQGDTVEFTAYLINEGSAKVIVKLSVPYAPFEYAFSKNEFDLEGGASDSVKITFKIPYGTPGTSFNIPILVKYTNACCVRDFPIPVTFSVYGPRVSVSLIGEPAPTCQRVYVGSDVSTLKLGIRNDGDEAGSYKLAITEKSPLYGNVYLSQTSIDLKTGETGYFNVYTSTFGLESGKTYSYAFSVASGQFNILNRNYCISVRPMNETVPATVNTSLVMVEMPEISVVDNVPVTYHLRVTNPTSAAYYNLSLYLEGVPYNWYSFSGEKSTIAPYSTKDYDLLMNGRTYDGQPSYREARAMIISNGYTIGSANYSLEVMPQNHTLQFTYTVEPTVQSGEVISAIEVRMNALNAGNMAEDFITPAIPQGTGLNYSFTPAYLNLTPGETGVFSITFWPSTDQVGGQNIPIKITSSGTESTKDVVIPSMTG
ncbi:MAG: hypothetical protein WCX64_06130, partial [Candidatus Micrarchaeia archaeon]